MIYPAWKPHSLEVDWKDLHGVHGTIQFVEGLVVLRTDDFKLIVLAESPDLGKDSNKP